MARVSGWSESSRSSTTSARGGRSPISAPSLRRSTAIHRASPSSCASTMGPRSRRSATTCTAARTSSSSTSPAPGATPPRGRGGTDPRSTLRGVRIDLNSDLGEGAGADAEIMPLITSANIACGAHAGDEATMGAAVALALRHGVAIGAHPVYRDAASFGRVPLDIPAEALRVDIRAQLVALRTVAERAGAQVTRVKAHGALYDRGERDEGIA